VQQHNDNDTRNNKLLAILSDPQANKLTNDDKTLVVAIRARCVSVSGTFRAPTSAQKSISTNGVTSATTPVASSNTLAGFSQRGITEGNAPQAAVKLKSVKKRWLLRRSVFIPAIALLFFSLTLGIYWATISIWAKTSPVVKTVKQDPSQKDPAVLAVPQLPAAAAPATPQNPASMPTGDKPESVPPL
jgi:Flp pilus assembly protein TadG